MRPGRLGTKTRDVCEKDRELNSAVRCRELMIRPSATVLCLI